MFKAFIPIARANQSLGIILGLEKRVEVSQRYTVAESIAVVERVDGVITECNHDTYHDYETVDALEFDPDSGRYAPTGNSIIETCRKCGAVYDHEDGTYTL